MLDWFEMRWNYGFIEFYSGVYYKEDIGAIINLIDFAEDEEMVKRGRNQHRSACFTMWQFPEH